MKVLCFPRDPNPYQELLHRALADEGIDMAYLPMSSRSQSLNLLLLPWQLLRARLTGVRILHLHWVFTFCPPTLAARTGLRLLAEAWYTITLGWARVIGISIVWTAHNVLPHDRVFADDRRARRTLLRRASAVLVHHESVPGELLRGVGAVTLPPVTVVPHGSYAGRYRHWPQEAARQALGLERDATVYAFVGRVSVAKGIDDLLAAHAATAAADDSGQRTILVIAGRCDDTALTERLRQAAADHPGLLLDLRRLDDDELSAYVCAADAVVLPFRKVTTSGSVILARSLERLVLVPDLPQFQQFGGTACRRFTPSSPGSLALALTELDQLGREQLKQWGVGDGDGDGDGESDWQVAARRTAAVYRRVARVPGVPGVPGVLGMLGISR